MKHNQPGRDGCSLEDLLPTYYIIPPKGRKINLLYNPEANRAMYKSVQQAVYRQRN
jgi:hypothetical protein